MNISYFENEDILSQKAVEYVIKEVRKKPNLLLCAATGNSPTKLYRNLAEESKVKKNLFEKIMVIPLDEWIGLPNSEGSCHNYINKHILTPLQVSPERYFAFNANANHLEKECERIQAILTKNGSIDLCILGLGKNGHLGFNEPADELSPNCHIASLTPQSQEHGMISNVSSKPSKGLTLGMKDILNSKKIILIVSGKGKEEVIEKLLSKKLTNHCPATLLWEHDNVECLIVNFKY